MRAALDRGDAVVATSRKPAEVAAAFPQAADRLLAVSLDLRDPASIAGTVRAALERFGRIDVLVNNAGYGIYGAVEEVSDEEAQAVFEINVFGLLRLTRAVLPSMRQRKAGHIVNLSSFGGLVGVPGAGIYCATKFALEGLSDSLAAEAAPLGVGVTLVEPGPFRTNFLGDSLVRAKEVIADYAETAGKARAALDTRHGNQAGDPVRAATAIVEAVTAPKPPAACCWAASPTRRSRKSSPRCRRSSPPGGR